MRICRHWGVAYPKSWDNYLPCNNLNLRTSLKNTFYTSMCWISTTKEETSAALKRCQQLAGELDKRVSHGERGEKEELKHVPGPSLLQLYECTRTQTTSSILRGNYFNWKFYTALLIKFEGIMKTFKKNFYQKRTQSELPVDTLWKKRVAKYQDSEVWTSQTAEKDLPCQLGRQTPRTRTNPPLRRKSLQQSQSKTQHILYIKGTFVCDKEERWQF